jgi:FdhD protein
VNRSILTVPVQRLEDESTASFQDLLAVGEPLAIRIGEKTISITVRTPGHDPELTAGFLFTEGILQGSDQIQDIQDSKKSITVQLNPDVEVDFERLQRNFYTTSSCGVCGKASIEALRMQGCPVLPLSSMAMPAVTIHQLPQAWREEQAVFERTGGLHAAALFDFQGKLIGLREAVGRYNAVDKPIGVEMLAGRTPLSNKLLLVSGRASFELTQKALMAGILILAAVGAPSSRAVETTLRFNMTLLGFVRNGGFNIYSGAERIQ